MHSIRIHQVIALILSLFYLIGFWHRGDKATARDITIKVLHCFYYSLLSISLVAGAITNEKLDQSIFLAEIAVEATVVAVKLWILIWKQDQILDLLNRICVFSIRNDEDYNHFQDKIRRFVKFALVFAVGVTVCGLLVSLILPLLRSEKSLFLEIGFPMDYRNNEVAFWIATVFLVFECILMTFVTIFSVIIWYLLLICSLRYEVLGSELRHMGRASKGKVNVTELQVQINFFKELSATIDSHLHIRRLVIELESFFGDLFFIQFGTSCLCICGSIYCLAFDIGEGLLERLIYLLVFFVLIAELFMITYFGNEIMLSSNRLSSYIFESDWYNTPQSTKKCVLIFGEYLKRPQKIMIGKLYPLTLQTFTRILNSAYSIFNILKSFQQ